MIGVFRNKRVNEYGDETWIVEVLLNDEGQSVEFKCTNKNHASRLAREISSCLISKIETLNDEIDQFIKFLNINSSKNSPYMAIESRKYWKIISGKTNSIYCFISKEDGYTKNTGYISRGDILPIRDWRTLAKSNVRGSLFDRTCWSKLFDEYGMVKKL